MKKILYIDFTNKECYNKQKNSRAFKERKFSQGEGCKL